MITKRYEFELKSIDEVEGVFEGVANTFGIVDYQNEIVMPGACTKTVRETKGVVKLFYNHGHVRRELPVGKTLELRVEGDQLIVKGKISKTSTGIDLIRLMLDKVLTEMSIGFEVIKQAWKDGVRQIQELKLLEISIVDWGANPQTSIYSVKSIEGVVNKYIDFETALQQSEMLSTPFRLQSVFGSAVDSILYDDQIDEMQRYNLLSDSLNQFTQRFGTWIEEAFSGGYLKEHCPRIETKGARDTLAPPTEPAAATQEEPQAADQAAFLIACEDIGKMLENMKNKITEV